MEQHDSQSDELTVISPQSFPPMLPVARKPQSTQVCGGDGGGDGGGGEGGGDGGGGDGGDMKQTQGLRTDGAACEIVCPAKQCQRPWPSWLPASMYE